MNEEYIENQKQLEDCVAFLEAQSELAIDLEFDKNRYRYGFNLCLVQIFAGGRCFVIDPLPEAIEINLLFPIIENPKIEKIVYSFGEDLRLLHSLGCFPKNTFDLAIALRLLDYPPASLAGALIETLEIEISKSAQTSNWFTRPLSEKQISYAATDVLYLLDMKKILVQQAIDKKVLAWIDEENAVIDTLDYSEVENSSFLKEKDKEGLTEFEFHLFKGMMELREEMAAKYNRPSYQIIDKDYLKELAERSNQIHRFDKIRGIYKALNNDSFKKMLWERREKMEQEANELNLSTTEKAYKRMGPEEYQLKKKERAIQDEAKKNIFKPIQELISKNQGENVVTYILGNRMMEELALGNLENLRDYKRRLIEECAEELALDITPYIGQKKS